MDKKIFLTGYGRGDYVDDTISVLEDLAFDKIVLFVGKNVHNDISKNVEVFKTKFKEAYPEKELEVVQIEHFDNYNEVYKTIANYILKNKETKFLMNMKYGTKTFSVIIALIATAFEHRCKLMTIEGERRNGEYIKGSSKPEWIDSGNKNKGVAVLSESYMLFNKGLVNSAYEIVSGASEAQKYKEYENTIKTYYLANNFRFAEIDREEVTKSHIPTTYKEHIFRLLNSKRKFLEKFEEEIEHTQGRENYKLLSNYIHALILEIVNSAKRSALHGEYDSAVAKLYRAIEMYIQNICIKNELTIIDEGFKNDVEKNKNPVVKLNLTKLEGIRKELYNEIDNAGGKVGLIKLYHVCKELNLKEIEKIDMKTLKTYLSKRNSSILAHGITPINEKTYDGFINIINNIIDKNELKSAEYSINRDIEEIIFKYLN